MVVLMAERRLHQVRRRPPIEGMARVSVPEPVSRDIDACSFRRAHHDPMNLRRIECAALA
jgi:hypothetical protein